MMLEDRAARYVARQRALAVNFPDSPENLALLGGFPGTGADTEKQGAETARRLRLESERSRSGEWKYEANRHLALLSVLDKCCADKLAANRLATDKLREDHDANSETEPSIERKAPPEGGAQWPNISLV